MKNPKTALNYFIYIFFIVSSICYAQNPSIPLKETRIKGKIKKSIQYKELKNMPRTGLYSFGYTIVDDILYIMSGDISDTNIKAFSNEIYSYDFLKNEWSTKKTKASAVSGNYVFNYNNYLYSFGGRKKGKSLDREYLNNQIDIYDIKNDTIYSSISMPHQAVNFAAIKANDNIILFGGSTNISETGKKTYTDKVHFFNLKTGLWYDIAPMPTAKETTGILVDNKVYLVGGYKNTPLKTIETYNLTTGAWENNFQLPYGLEKPALATKNGIIYIYEAGIFYTYDTVNKIFKEFKIQNIEVDNSQIVIYKNDLYLLGGHKTSIGDDPKKPKPPIEMGIPDGFRMDWSTNYIEVYDNIYKISLKQFEVTPPKLVFTK